MQVGATWMMDICCLLWYCRRDWQSAPVFLPGEFQRSMAGYSPGGLLRVGHDWMTNTHFVKLRQHQGQKLGGIGGDEGGLLHALGFFLGGLFKSAFLVAQLVKNLSSEQDTWVWSLGQEDPLEKGITTHSSILAWRIPWTEKPGELLSIAKSCKESDTTEQLTLFKSAACAQSVKMQAAGTRYLQHLPSSFQSSLAHHDENISSDSRDLIIMQRC